MADGHPITPTAFADGRTWLRADRENSLLSALRDVSIELAGLAEPEAICRACLLTTAGSAGASKGFVLLLDTFMASGKVVAYGCTAQEVHNLEHNIRRLIDQYVQDQDYMEAGGSDFSAGNQPARCRMVLNNNTRESAIFPHPTSVLMQGVLESGSVVLMGLSPRLNGTLYTEDDATVLLGLADHMVQQLNLAVNAKVVESLNKGLARRNSALEQAAEEARRSQQRLDKKIFYLNTLYDATLELGPLRSAQELLETFLLLCMGTFGFRHGFGFYLDQKTHELQYSVRQPSQETPPPFEAEQAEKVLLACLSGVDFNALAPMRVVELPEQRMNSIQGLPLTAQQGVLFRLDESCLGLVGFGPMVSGEEMHETEQHLLMTHAANFLVFLKNARSFTTISDLNVSLEARNEELTATINELTASRRKIELLERAGNRLRSMLHTEADRLSRASVWDVLLIVLAGALLGLVFNLSSPNGIPLRVDLGLAQSLPHASVEETGSMVQSGAVLVDARPAEFYDLRHMEGAINLPPTLFDFLYAMKLGMVELDRPVIVYGDTTSKLYAHETASLLLEQGHERVLLLGDWE